MTSTYLPAHSSGIFKFRKNMRGSTKWQVIQLVRIIFQEGLSKKERSNEKSFYYKMVTQHTTMETYKLIWIEFAKYTKENSHVQDIEDLNNQHIKEYLLHKISNKCARQTLEKLSAALGKLETALIKYSQLSGGNRQYNFNNRTKILNYAREFELVYDGYHGRAYDSPEKIISLIDNTRYKLCAKIQYEGGARIGGLEYLKKEVCIAYQKLEINGLVDALKIDRITSKNAYLKTMQGLSVDPVLIGNGVEKKVGKIMTVEKGGRPGIVYVSPRVYEELELFFTTNEILIVNRFDYMKKIQKVCRKLGVRVEGSHGFRWSHVQNRQEELLLSGFSEDEALLLNSVEHKHWRSEITTHYLG